MNTSDHIGAAADVLICARSIIQATETNVTDHEETKQRLRDAAEMLSQLERYIRARQGNPAFKPFEFDFTQGGAV